jgi:hypothetical protein
LVVKIQLAFMCAPPARCAASSHMHVAFATSAIAATAIINKPV